MKPLPIIALASATVLGSAAISAEPYRIELFADYLTGNVDVDNFDVNEDDIRFGGTYYFTPVEIGDNPLAEAAFISRSSYARGSVSVGSVDDDIDDLIDADGFGVNGVYIDPETGWYGGLGYVRTDFHVDAASNATFLNPEYDGYSARIGKYVGRNTTLELGYNYIDFDSSTVGIDFGGLESESVGMGFKHFGRISESWRYALAGSYYLVDLKRIGLPDPDADNLFDNDGDVYSFKATLYPVRNFGFGVSYVNSDDLLGLPYLTSAAPQNDGIGVFADWFITERFSLGATYSNNEYDIEDDDNLQAPSEVEEDFVTIRAAYRF